MSKIHIDEEERSRWLVMLIHEMQLLVPRCGRAPYVLGLGMPLFVREQKSHDAYGFPCRLESERNK